MNKYFTMALLLSWLIFTGQTSAIAHGDKYATIVGRLVLKSPAGGNYNKMKVLYFSKHYMDKSTTKIKRHDSGYFSISLPLGDSYLEELHYFDGAEFFKKFSPGYLNISLDSADRIYYIGDILVAWDINVSDERPHNEGANSGLLGYVIGREVQKSQERKIPGEALPVVVSSNPATIAHFASELGVNLQNIIISPVRVRN